MRILSTLTLLIMTIACASLFASTAMADQPEDKICNQRNCDKAYIMASTGPEPICPDASCDPIPASDLPDPECLGLGCEL